MDLVVWAALTDPRMGGDPRLTHSTRLTPARQDEGAHDVAVRVDHVLLRILLLSTQRKKMLHK